MKYLTEKKWDKFNISVNGKTIKSGAVFEDLTKALLDAIYGKNKWEATQASWDGSKDFFYKENKSFKWAECKNYKKDIQFKVLSPTIVMAQLSDINELLIFSYSRINKNAKCKILTSADLNGYSVRFYDDENLETLILSHEKVLKEFFDLTIKDKSAIQPNPEFSTDYSIYCGEIHSAKMNQITRKMPQSINLYDCIEIDLMLNNKSKKNIDLKIRFNVKETLTNSCDLYHFDIFPVELKDETIKIILAPFESKIFKIFAMPIVYKKRLRIPSLLIEESNKVIKEISFQGFECKFVRQSYMIGKVYNGILNDFKTECEDNAKKFACFAVYGCSGIGKTRILNECQLLARLYDFSIFNYQTINMTENQSFAYVLRQIILAIYKIENDNIIKKIDANNIIAHMLNDIDLISDISSCKAFIDKYVGEIFIRLTKQKHCLTIDNLQNFDESILYFLEKLIFLGLNSQKSSPLKILYCVNTDLVTRSQQTLGLFINSKKSGLYSYNLEGFKEERDVENYFRQLLKIGNDYNINWTKKLYLKSHGNPFYINVIARSLLEDKYDEFSAEEGSLIEYNHIYKLMDSLPVTVEVAIDTRWKRFIEKENSSDFLNNSLLILSALYVCEKLPGESIKLYGLDASALKKLQDIGFVVFEKNYYCYCHDQIKYYMVKNFHYFCDAEELEYMFLDYIIKNNIESYFIGITKMIIDVYKSDKYPSSVISSLNAEKFILYSDSAIILLREIMTKAIKYHDNCEQWIYDMTYLCFKYRELFGDIKVKQKYELITNIITNSDLYNSSVSGIFLEEYCEVLHESNLAREGVKILNAYLNNLEKNCSDVFDEAHRKRMAKLYNRIYVNSRKCSDNPLMNDMLPAYLKKSRDYDDSDEMELTNSADEGYLYYCEKRYKDSVLKHWYKSRSFYKEEKNINDVTTLPYSIRLMNYLRISTQIAIIERDFNAVDRFTADAIKILDKSSTCENHRNYFYRWFLLALTERLIMENAVKNRMAINDNLDRLNERNYLMSADNNYTLIWLKSNYLFKCGFFEDAFESLKKVYVELDSTLCIAYRTVVMKQLLENMLNMVICEKYDGGKKLFSFVKNTEHLAIINRRLLRMETENAEGLICTSDELFSLPCL